MKPGAVREAAQQRAAPPERDLGELDRAFDQRLLARHEAAERPNRRSVLIALRQEAEKVRDPLDAELREARRHDRTDAGQASRPADRTPSPRSAATLRAVWIRCAWPIRTRIASTSTAAPRGSWATPIAARAGYGSVKYSAIDFVDERKMGEVRQIDGELDRVRERPASGFGNRREILEHLPICSRGPPSTIFIVVGSSGICPER